MSIVDAAARIGAARAYVDALVTHDPSSVPLHPDCTRTELGVRTGRSGDHIRRSLANGPQFKLIHAISEFDARVDDAGVVHTTYYVHVHPKPLRLAAKVTESFAVDDAGLIRKLVASFGLPTRR
ncbi:hypothetical protein HH308_26660 [Gordonia sp. TBRC 11910]|uniref:DUF8021 domain-containing protein n=1 Tax=Gordonia asplenii TaxID=2725283 RepID=A0A848L8L0_9ACTN|nr:hypothetical protein [Gordonia asplenii]NMO04811.1 hypothetical protein [Gordonia asplenii]